MTNFKTEYAEYFEKEVKGQSDEFLAFYDEVDIVDFKFNDTLKLFTYPCPCGDIFTIELDDLKMGETIARCNSCSLLVNVVYSEKDLKKYDSSN